MGGNAERYILGVDFAGGYEQLVPDCGNAGFGQLSPLPDLTVDVTPEQADQVAALLEALVPPEETALMDKLLAEAEAWRALAGREA